MTRTKQQTQISLVYLSDIEDKTTFTHVNDFAYIRDTDEFAIRVHPAVPSESGLNGVIRFANIGQFDNIDGDAEFSAITSAIGTAISTHNTDANAHSTIITALETAIGGKVDKVEGKGLSTNDYTTDEKSKLGGIDTGAQKNVQSDWAQTDDTKDDYIKGKPTIPTISTDITKDGESDTKTASPKAVKTYVDSKVASTYKASGSLIPKGITSALLIPSNLGNVYNITSQFETTNLFVEDAGKVYEQGTNIVVVLHEGLYKFDVLSGFIDLSLYDTKDEVDGKLGDLELSDLKDASSTAATDKQVLTWNNTQW